MNLRQVELQEVSEIGLGDLILLMALSRRFCVHHCEGCCKDDVSSISCNESTLHISNISPTEICLLVAMVLRSVSPIVRASNLYCFTARLFSICFRLGEEVRTEEPRSPDHTRERADPGHASSVPGPDRVSKDHDNRERPARNQNRPIRKGPATQPGRGPLLAPTMARSCYAQGRGCRAQELGSEKTTRDERMTKNKTREGPLPPAGKGVNDARPGLPNPTVRKPVTWVQPEPTTSDVTRPQQLSPDTTWAEPSVAESKLAKGSPGLSTTRDQTKE